MINKRLLIKNLLAHNNENTFFDKKRKISISTQEGKGKFLKHICALSNSNPHNNSYIVIGVDDETSIIYGIRFFDDSKLQNLINAYLTNPPIVHYDNIPFPHLLEDKVVGLVTIRPQVGLTALRKNIWKYYGGMVFFRDGSISMPKVFDIEIKDINSTIVKAIEKHSQNNVELTLNGVFDFFNNRKDFSPNYKVFKEYFVVCWSGEKEVIDGESYFSRVDIELVNEQVRLFFSVHDRVKLSYNENHFKIVEYVNLGLHNANNYLKLEEITIHFGDNAGYSINSQLVFTPPKYDINLLHHVFKTNNNLLFKLERNEILTEQEELDLKNLPITYLICHLNYFDRSLIYLEQAKPLLKAHSILMDNLYKQTNRIIRKLKYS